MIFRMNFRREIQEKNEKTAGRLLFSPLSPQQENIKFYIPGNQSRIWKEWDPVYNCRASITAYAKAQNCIRGRSSRFWSKGGRKKEKTAGERPLPPRSVCCHFFRIPIKGLDPNPFFVWIAWRGLRKYKEILPAPTKLLQRSGYYSFWGKCISSYKRTKREKPLIY